MKDAIREAIEKKFGKIDNSGCYSNGSWMSTECIFELVCDVIDDNEYLFNDED
jgi:hypothetical protein